MLHSLCDLEMSPPHMNCINYIEPTVYCVAVSPLTLDLLVLPRFHICFEFIFIYLISLSRMEALIANYQEKKPHKKMT